MLRRIRWEWWLLAGLLCLRLPSMALLPLTDTTEARYGEIARLMAASGDWITPWFQPGVPFWGKPPLSFWCEALSFNVLGVSEFAARLPSWLATLATLLPMFALARAWYGERAARRALLIFSSCVLVYVLSGAVLTDPFLVLGTTLSMTAFVLAPQQPKFTWRYGFFAGLAIGLLAKGPVALVLVAGAILPWLLWHHRKAGSHLRALPWVRGCLLLAALSLPWYVAAEIRTPGFLHYFIVGEHFLRYLDPGWTGDLYGSAHRHAYGTIWWYWVVASAPWGIIALAWLLVRLFHPVGRQRVRSALVEPKVTYLLAWSLFVPVFFSAAANILWTYMLPALPAFGILLAGHAERWPGLRRQPWRTPLLAAFITPLLGLAITITALIQPARLKTQKGLIQYVQQHASSGDPVVYVGSRPFSARFYSRETARLVPLQHLPEMLATASTPLYLAVPKSALNDVEAELPRPLKPRFRSDRYVLLMLANRAGTGTAGRRSPAPPGMTATGTGNG